MPVVEVENLHKSYGSVHAVVDVSFAVEQGEIFGILGPNGAGKTTTVECVEGLVKPDSGTVSVLGLDPQTDNEELTQVLGAQLQQSRLPGKLRVYEALELYASFYPDPDSPDRLLEKVGLTGKRKSSFDKLSGGQQQRLSIALALIGRPKVAILDELTTGLDPRARRETWQLIRDVRDDGVTILLVTHFMEEAERLCDRLALIDEGKVVAVDTPAGLVQRVGSEQRIAFRPSKPLDEAHLSSLPEVTSVVREGPEVVVSGSGNLLHTVTAALQELDVAPLDLSLQQASLDDAFLALTGKPFDEEASVREDQHA